MSSGGGLATQRCGRLDFGAGRCKGAISGKKSRISAPMRKPERSAVIESRTASKPGSIQREADLLVQIAAEAVLMIVLCMRSIGKIVDASLAAALVRNREAVSVGQARPSASRPSAVMMGRL